MSDIMNLRAVLGVIRKCGDYRGKYSNKKVIIPQNPELFDENELVIIIKAEDFQEISNDLKGLIKVMDSARECEHDY